MIAIQRLNGEPFVLNSDLIETAESTPDTVIKLSTGRTIVTRNSIEDIVRKVVKYKQLCSQALHVTHSSEDGSAGKASRPDA